MEKERAVEVDIRLEHEDLGFARLPRWLPAPRSKPIAGHTATRDGAHGCR